MAGAGGEGDECGVEAMVFLGEVEGGGEVLCGGGGQLANAGGGGGGGGGEGVGRVPGT